MGEVVTGKIVKGLVVRDAQGRLFLTARGRAVLEAMLPELFRDPRIRRPPTFVGGLSGGGTPQGGRRSTFQSNFYAG